MVDDPVLKILKQLKKDKDKFADDKVIFNLIENVEKIVIDTALDECYEEILFDYGNIKILIIKRDSIYEASYNGILFTNVDIEELKNELKDEINSKNVEVYSQGSSIV